MALEVWAHLFVAVAAIVNLIWMFSFGFWFLSGIPCIFISLLSLLLGCRSNRSCWVHGFSWDRQGKFPTGELLGEWVIFAWQFQAHNRLAV